MAKFSTSLGYSANTEKDWHYEFYGAAKVEFQKNGLDFPNSFDEYTQSNMYKYNKALIDSGFIKVDEELVQAIDNMLNYLQDKESTLGQGGDITNSGFPKILEYYSDYYQVASAVSGQEPDISAGEVLICMENPRVANLELALKDTYPPFLSRPHAILDTDPRYPDQSLSINYENSAIQVYYKEGTTKDIYCKISLTKDPNKPLPSNFESLVREAFLSEFNRIMGIGSYFYPERYVSSQSIWNGVLFDFAIDFEVRHNFTGFGDLFLPGVYNTPFGERLKTEDANILVEVV